MWCKYIIKVRGIVIRELKHQTFLIHVWHGWPRRTGSGTRFVCKMQLLSKTSWNHHERRQNNSDENAFQRFALSFVSFLRRKHDFRQRISTFVWRILFETQNLNFWFQPENSRFEVRDRSSRTSWHAQWLSCCKNTSGWRPWYQERLVLKFPIILRWTAKHINIVTLPPLSQKRWILMLFTHYYFDKKMKLGAFYFKQNT